MSIDWFRSWHGAPTDPKWLLIAKMAMKRTVTQCNTISPGMVSAVVWALFDHASQHSERGHVDDFDAETYASYSGFDEESVTAIIAALNEKKLILSGVLSAWQKRQPKREDSSTERVREHRNALKRSETQGNAREEKIREEKIDSEAKASGADAPPDPSIPERDFFFRGREVLGKGSGGLIAKLLKAKGGNVALARAALEQASQKDSPTEYVAAVCRGPPAAKPLTEFQRKQQETNDVRAQLRSFANGGGSGGYADRILPANHGERAEGVRGGTGAVVRTLPRTFGEGGD